MYIGFFNKWHFKLCWVFTDLMIILSMNKNRIGGIYPIQGVTMAQN